MSDFDKIIEDLTNQEDPKINGIALKAVDKTGISSLTLQLRNDNLTI